MSNLVVQTLSVCRNLVVIAGLCLWPFSAHAQGSVSIDQGSTGVGQPRIYLPLVTSNPSGSALHPYTGPPPEDPTWLEYINYFRSQAGLARVADNSAWSQGDWLHARYMVKNDYIGHSEDPGNLWFTVEGDLAARTSNLLASSSHSASDLAAIDGWMRAPFHALGILDPQLFEVGFGSFREQDGGFQMAAGLDVLRGQQDLSPTFPFPIAWPGEGTSVVLTSLSGEYPDPLSSCPGFTAPAGLPIILQLGAGAITPQVASHSFKRGDQELPHCVFDESTYQNPDPSAGSLGRAILNSRDAVVLIPRDPLNPGSTYTVSITVNGVTYQWTLHALGSAAQSQSTAAGQGSGWYFSPPLE